jgi:hypothetical protein
MKVAKASRAIFTFLSQNNRLLSCCMLELLIPREYNRYARGRRIC